MEEEIYSQPEANFQKLSYLPLIVRSPVNATSGRFSWCFRICAIATDKHIWETFVIKNVFIGMNFPCCFYDMVCAVSGHVVSNLLVDVTTRNKIKLDIHLTSHPIYRFGQSFICRTISNFFAIRFPKIGLFPFLNAGDRIVEWFRICIQLYCVKTPNISHTLEGYSGSSNFTSIFW